MSSRRSVLANLFAVNFVYIALKAFQQKNVAGNQYLPVIPTSLCMAACEVFTVYAVATSGFHLQNIVAVGLGGGMGAMTAMLVHSRIYKGR